PCFKSYREVCIMTCREFKDAAALLTLWELARSDDQQLFDHAMQCATCAVWLDQQQTLAAGMQTLQARTAGREAGPHVEKAVLQAFKRVPWEAPKSVAVRRYAPIAFRLSRFFEMGAYAAVAAGIVVGVFLGVRLSQQHPAPHPVASQSVPAAAAPMPQAQAKSTSQAEVVPMRELRPPVKHDVATQAVSQGVRG